jgi:hypothetical protein
VQTEPEIARLRGKPVTLPAMVCQIVIERFYLAMGEPSVLIEAARAFEDAIEEIPSLMKSSAREMIFPPTAAICSLRRRAR